MTGESTTIVARREFTNEIGERVIIAVGDDGIGTGAVLVEMNGPHSRGEWTITAREASELRRALEEYLSWRQARDANLGKKD